MWYTGAWPGPWPLILLAIPWLVRLAVGGFSLRPSMFDVSLWMFLVSAGVGVWAAYDPGPAWAKLWLIVAAVGLYYAVAHQPDLNHLYVTLSFFGLFGVALSLYFFATNDWAAQTVKVPALTALGERISALLPSLPGHRMHPNVVGGMLAAVMPVYVALIVVGRRNEAIGFNSLVRRCLPVGWLLASGVAALAWLVSQSRGAWLGVLSVAGVWVAWRGVGWWVRRRGWQADRTWIVRLLVMAGLLVVGLALLAVVISMVLSGRLPGTETLAGRLNLLRDSLLLARDYLFTGVGLGMFPAHFSIYALLIHVYYTVYSHSFLVDLLVEQGLMGLVGYLLLVVACVTFGLRRLRLATKIMAWTIEVGLASLGVMLVHGLVDDVLYGSRGVLLLFVPFGIIVAASGVIDRESDAESWVGRGGRRRWAWVVALAVLFVVVGLIRWRPMLGAWYADLGAVEQARVELNAYDPDHFDNPTLDQVRQRVDLEGAVALLDRAMQVDPANPTARQRMAAIELSRGQYEAAFGQMQAAWDAGHCDQVTRLLLGDALVATGRIEKAAEIVDGLTWAESRLLGQAWYRYWVNEDYRRAAYAWGAVVLLNPENKEAAHWQASAEARLNE